VLHLQRIVCGPLNVLADRMAVSMSTKKRLKMSLSRVP